MPDLGLEVLFKGKNMLRLLGGLGVALRISAISVLISLPLGILLGVLMTFKNPILKAILRVYLEIIRIMPQMVLLFLVYFGTTAETYLVKNYPDIPLQKYDSYATAKNALENGNGVAWANDNTEVIAFAKQNPGYTVGIPSLGSQDTIAPAVSKGNTTLLDWINDEIKSLADEQFFHKDYEETLVDTYGIDYEDELVVEGGVTNA